jgi:hypothetical protein
MVIYYSPKESAAIKRAEILMIKVHAELQKQSKNDNRRNVDGSPLLGFIDRHQGNVGDLFRRKADEK